MPEKVVLRAEPDLRGGASPVLQGFEPQNDLGEVVSEVLPPGSPPGPRRGRWRLPAHVVRSHQCELRLGGPEHAVPEGFVQGGLQVGVRCPGVEDGAGRGHPDLSLRALRAEHRDLRERQPVEVVLARAGERNPHGLCLCGVQPRPPEHEVTLARFLSPRPEAQSEDVLQAPLGNELAVDREGRS